MEEMPKKTKKKAQSPQNTGPRNTGPRDQGTRDLDARDAVVRDLGTRDLNEIAAGFDARFDSIETELTEFKSQTNKRLGSLSKAMNGLRSETKNLLEYVAFIDEDLQTHKSEKALHGGV